MTVIIVCDVSESIYKDEHQRMPISVMGCCAITVLTWSGDWWTIHCKYWWRWPLVNAQSSPPAPISSGIQVIIHSLTGLHWQLFGAMLLKYVCGVWGLCWVGGVVVTTPTCLCVLVALCSAPSSHTASASWLFDMYNEVYHTIPCIFTCSGV